MFSVYQVLYLQRHASRNLQSKRRNEQHDHTIQRTVSDPLEAMQTQIQNAKVTGEFSSHAFCEIAANLIQAITADDSVLNQINLQLLLRFLQHFVIFYHWPNVTKTNSSTILLLDDMDNPCADSPRLIPKVMFTFLSAIEILQDREEVARDQISSALHDGHKKGIAKGRRLVFWSSLDTGTRNALEALADTIDAVNHAALEL